MRRIPILSSKVLREGDYILFVDSNRGNPFRDFKYSKWRGADYVVMIERKSKKKIFYKVVGNSWEGEVWGKVSSHSWSLVGAVWRRLNESWDFFRLSKKEKEEFKLELTLSEI